MGLFARLLALWPSISLLAPEEAVVEFGRGIRAQLDFELEARNNKRFRRLFATDPDVVFPALVPHLCGRRVLTMELIAGHKILDARTTSPDQRRLARVGLRMLFQMIFVDGFVHADLHPGNILVTPEGKLAVLDVGLVAELAESHRLGISRYFAAWAVGDGLSVARIMGELSPSVGRIADPAGFSRDVCAFVERHRGKRLGEVQVGQVIFEVMQILRRHRVRANATFTLINIAIAVTEGIGKQLDPSLDLFQEAMQFFARYPQRPASAQA